MLIQRVGTYVVVYRKELERFALPFRNVPVASFDPQGMAVPGVLRPARADTVPCGRGDRAGSIRLPERQGDRARARLRSPFVLPASHRGVLFRQDVHQPGARSPDEGAPGSMGGGPGRAARARCDLL